MIGGLAVLNNLVCVTWSAGRGHVFLYDLEAKERVSSWINPVGPSGFSDAGGVAIDRHFRIYVADAHNHCVRRFNAFGQHLGDLGLPAPKSGDRGRDRNGVLDRPHAVTTYQDRVYVAMGDRPRQRAVQCFDSSGRVLRGLAAQGDAAKKWSAPRGIWADERGVIISDTFRGRLQAFRPDGVFVQEFGVSTADRPARPGHLIRLANGVVLVVDHSGVRAELLAIRPDGTLFTLSQLTENCRDPLALALDGRQRVYILDHGGERVLRTTPDLDFDCVLFDLAEYDRDAPVDPGS